MNGTELAAVIVAVTGALGAIFAGIRNLQGDRFKKDVEASAALLTGHTNMVAALQNELERIRSDHAEDRAAWQADRALVRRECRDDIDRLRSEHHAELLVAYERIDDLSAQVYTLQNKPPDMEVPR